MSWWGQLLMVIAMAIFGFSAVPACATGRPTAVKFDQEKETPEWDPRGKRVYGVVHENEAVFVTTGEFPAGSPTMGDELGKELSQLWAATRTRASKWTRKHQVSWKTRVKVASQSGALRAPVERETETEDRGKQGRGPPAEEGPASSGSRGGAASTASVGQPPIARDELSAPPAGDITHAGPSSLCSPVGLPRDARGEGGAEVGAAAATAVGTGHASGVVGSLPAVDDEAEKCSAARVGVGDEERFVASGVERMAADGEAIVLDYGGGANGCGVEESPDTAFTTVETLSTPEGYHLGTSAPAAVIERLEVKREVDKEAGHTLVLDGVVLALDGHPADADSEPTYKRQAPSSTSGSVGVPAASALQRLPPEASAGSTTAVEDLTSTTRHTGSKGADALAGAGAGADADADADADAGAGADAGADSDSDADADAALSFVDLGRITAPVLLVLVLPLLVILIRMRWTPRTLSSGVREGDLAPESATPPALENNGGAVEDQPAGEKAVGGLSAPASACDEGGADAPFAVGGTLLSSEEARTQVHPTVDATNVAGLIASNHTSRTCTPATGDETGLPPPASPWLVLAEAVEGKSNGELQGGQREGDAALEGGGGSSSASDVSGWGKPEISTPRTEDEGGWAPLTGSSSILPRWGGIDHEDGGNGSVQHQHQQLQEGEGKEDVRAAVLPDGGRVEGGVNAQRGREGEVDSVSMTQGSAGLGISRSSDLAGTSPTDDAGSTSTHPTEDIVPGTSTAAAVGAATSAAPTESQALASLASGASTTSTDCTASPFAGTKDNGREESEGERKPEGRMEGGGVTQAMAMAQIGIPDGDTQAQAHIPLIACLGPIEEQPGGEAVGSGAPSSASSRDEGGSDSPIADDNSASVPSTALHGVLEISAVVSSGASSGEASAPTGVVGIPAPTGRIEDGSAPPGTESDLLQGGTGAASARKPRRVNRRRQGKRDRVGTWKQSLAGTGAKDNTPAPAGSCVSSQQQQQQLQQQQLQDEPEEDDVAGPCNDVMEEGVKTKGNNTKEVASSGKAEGAAGTGSSAKAAVKTTRYAPGSAHGIFSAFGATKNPSTGNKTMAKDALGGNRTTAQVRGGGSMTGGRLSAHEKRKRKAIGAAAGGTAATGGDGQPSKAGTAAGVAAGAESSGATSPAATSSAATSSAAVAAAAAARKNAGAADKCGRQRASQEEARRRTAAAKKAAAAAAAAAAKEAEAAAWTAWEAAEQAKEKKRAELEASERKKKAEAKHQRCVEVQSAKIRGSAEAKTAAGRRGMVNRRNDCFMNTAFQTLRALPALLNALLRYDGATSPKPGKKKEEKLLTWAVSRAFLAMQDTDEQAGPFRPTELIETLSELFGEAVWTNGQQEDAGNILTSILDRIWEETCDKNTGVSLVDSARGFITYTRTCDECKGASSRTERWVFRLSCNRESGEVMAPEDGGWDIKSLSENERCSSKGSGVCEVCQEKVKKAGGDTSKKVTLTFTEAWRVPDEFLLYFNRTLTHNTPGGWQRTRCNGEVKIAEAVDKSTTFDGPSTGIARIVAVGSHRGQTVHRGHWIAHHRHRGGNSDVPTTPAWLKFDDGAVSEEEFNFTTNQNFREQVTLFAYATVHGCSSVDDWTATTVKCGNSEVDRNSTEGTHHGTNNGNKHAAGRGWGKGACAGQGKGKGENKGKSRRRGHSLR
eukprot:g11976.t1